MLVKGATGIQWLLLTEEFINIWSWWKNFHWRTSRISSTGRAAAISRDWQSWRFNVVLHWNRQFTKKWIEWYYFSNTTSHMECHLAYDLSQRSCITKWPFKDITGIGFDHLMEFNTVWPFDNIAVVVLARFNCDTFNVCLLITKRDFTYDVFWKLKESLPKVLLYIFCRVAINTKYS